MDNIQEKKGLTQEPSSLCFVMNFKDYKFIFEDETLILKPDQMKNLILNLGAIKLSEVKN